jgi:hypothetical protein
MRSVVVTAVLAMVLGLLSVQPSMADDHDAAAACEDLAGLVLDDAQLSITAAYDTDGEAEGQTGLPAFCDVRVTLAEAINIAVWLPAPEAYNDRLQNVGGGGYAGSISFGAMGGVLRDGYVTGSTDTGHPASAGGSFAFEPDGDGSGLNEQLIEDFAQRSLYELTETSKQLLEAFYGKAAEYTYFTGCSTGGRQGLIQVQNTPEAYDGVLAEAPAINWDRFIPAEIWPQVVYEDVYGSPSVGPSFCELEAAAQAAVDACDTLDGVADGLIEDPRRCDYDATALIGEEIPCFTGTSTFTAEDAEAINRIWEGPVGPDGEQLWYGLAKGAPLYLLAGSPGVPPFNGPFPIATTHQQWSAVDPTWSLDQLDYEEWLDNWASSKELFNDVIGTDAPDISAFADAGGKVLIFHGWDDQLIMPEGSIDYYERVIDEFSSTRQVQRFARLFMVPGLYHCGAGPGPDVVDPFQELVDWVEDGDAPDTLDAIADNADGETVTDVVCAYPYVPRYDGTGDPEEAGSYDCKPNFGRWGTPGANPGVTNGTSPVR